MAPLVVLLVAGLAGPAVADHGAGGAEQVTAPDRTDFELAAEAFMIQEVDLQRQRGNSRAGTTYDGFTAQPAFEAWTDMLTVARAWADELTTATYRQNPDADRQVGHATEVRTCSGIEGIRFDDGSGPLTERMVIDAARDALDSLWDACGTLWLAPPFDHMVIGIDLFREQTFPPNPDIYDVMAIEMVFRDHDGTEIDDQAAFPLDGGDPPQESDHAALTRPAVQQRDVSDTCDGSGSDFDDVPADGIFCDTIRCLTQYDVTQGFDDGTYQPAGTVTLGQLSAFLRRSVEAGGVDAPTSATCGGDGVFAGDLSWAVDEGVLPAGGCDRGAEVVTRTLMARMVRAALEASGVALPGAPDDYFLDDEGLPNELAHDVLADLRVVSGTARGEFSPGATVTRGQMSVFLGGVIDVLRENAA